LGEVLVDDDAVEEEEEVAIVDDKEFRFNDELEFSGEFLFEDASDEGFRLSGEFLFEDDADLTTTVFNSLALFGSKNRTFVVVS